MKNKILKNEYCRVSEITPEFLQKYIIDLVGEKAQDKLYNFLKDLSYSYPNFKKWFYDTVYPEVREHNEEREIIIVISEFENGKSDLTGIAILKKKESEKKICTFRVHEDYRNQGIGKSLFEECFNYLDTKKPIITISEDRKIMFEKYINNYQFEETQILDNYYKEGSTEYVYNGTLI